jgi:hypothetical protein
MNQQDRTEGDAAIADKENLTTADLAEGDARSTEGLRKEASDAPAEDRTEPLFPGEKANELRARWDSIQTGFVDEPRKAVEAADSLVASAMKRLAETFAKERSGLEAQWDRGDDVSTEDLRIALRRYRSFFGRLLSM